MKFEEARMIGGQRFDRVASVLALLGALAVMVANVVGVWLHPETGFFADTISNLAAGRHSWVLDGALLLFALGMAAVGAAMWRYRLDGTLWRVGSTLTVLVAAAIVVIALYEEYGDGDPGGVTIHLEVVIGMALAFTLTTWIVAPGLYRVGSRWSALSHAARARLAAARPRLLPRARRLGRARRARCRRPHGRVGAGHGPLRRQAARGGQPVGRARGRLGGLSGRYRTFTRSVPLDCLPYEFRKVNSSRPR